MAPDRLDTSSMESAVTHVLECAEAVYSVKEEDIVNGRSSIKGLNEGSPISEKLVEKSNHSDDDLTSLTWLHQQNLLKRLDISNSSKDVKDDNILNNNICEDGANLSENTNSASSLDDNYIAENNYKNSIQSPNYHSLNNSHKKLSQIFKEKMLFDGTQSNQSKISLSNNSFPVSNRNKHPTHIPYDPHLHRNSKPPYSFSCLIFMAIEDSPVKALPVKEVYAWILDHFPYFRNAPTGWKNSVRHNLSLNKCFRKVEKAPNLGKGSLWMVDAQYRPNLIQALSRAPFLPPTVQNLSSSERIPKKNSSTRLPDPVLFPYLSKRLASSSISENLEVEIDSDVDAAAAAMLSFKHGPIILNHNKDRKRKLSGIEKLVPIITRSSSEDHTYSCITSVKLESSKQTLNIESPGNDDEQRKIAEGADALLNLAGVSTVPNYSQNNSRSTSGPVKSENTSEAKRKNMNNDYTKNEKRQRRWREWGEGNHYLKQVKG